MIYYIYTLTFFNQEGKKTTVESRIHCEDADYQQDVIRIKGITYEQAKALNGDLDISDYTDSIEFIQEQEYRDFFSGGMPTEEI